MSSRKITLPEFAFIEGSKHEEPNILEGRTVFQHIRSYTIFELFDISDAIALNPEVQTYKFEHINIFATSETLILTVHFTFAEPEDMPAIFEKAANWYRDYCNWEDRNIAEDGF
jgi:hypothetical protein